MLIVGNAAANTLRGTFAADEISGLGGNDALFGRSGRDTVSGGPGADRIVGGEGRDILSGGDGNDLIYGFAATDTVGASANITLTNVGARSFSNPVFATSAPGDPDRLYVVEQHTGRILILNTATGATNATPFLDLPDASLAAGNEQGLLGLAFDPDYQTNGRFFVYLTQADGDVELRSYQRSTTNPDLAQAASGNTILLIDKDNGALNHNGGWLGFGPDGMLYAGVGDEGLGGDPNNNAQNLNVLWGKMLRLDVGGDDFAADPNRDYAIPDDNPFVGPRRRRRDLGVRPAQPLAQQLRPDHRGSLHRRRRPGATRGDRLPARQQRRRRQLRLEGQGGRHRLRRQRPRQSAAGQPGAGRPAGRLPARCHRRLRGRRRLRLPRRERRHAGPLPLRRLRQRAALELPHRRQHRGGRDQPHGATGVRRRHHRRHHLLRRRRAGQPLCRQHQRDGVAADLRRRRRRRRRQHQRRCRERPDIRRRGPGHHRRRRPARTSSPAGRRATSCAAGPRRMCSTAAAATTSSTAAPAGTPSPAAAARTPSSSHRGQAPTQSPTSATTSTRFASATVSASPQPSQALQFADEVGDDVVFSFAGGQVLTVLGTNIAALSNDLMV